MSAGAGFDINDPRTQARLIRWAVRTAILVLIVGFVLSWDALTSLARASYIDPHLAMAFPATVDALEVTSFVTAALLSNRGWRTRCVPVLVTGCFVALSVVGNAAHALTKGGRLHPSPMAAAAVSAIPPAAAAITVWLISFILHHLMSKPATDSATGTAPVHAQSANPQADGYAQGATGYAAAAPTPLHLLPSSDRLAIGAGTGKDRVRAILATPEGARMKVPEIAARAGVKDRTVYLVKAEIKNGATG